MRTLIGAAIAVFLAAIAATGVGIAVSVSSAPDKSVNFTDVHSPDLWADTVDYGRR